MENGKWKMENDQSLPVVTRVVRETLVIGHSPLVIFP
jgi:hypothetical protein